jgi:GH35 family endo-1,4-beta-xylanase
MLINSLLVLVIYAVGITEADKTLGTLKPTLFFGSVTANTSAQVLDSNYQQILATQFAGVALMDGFIWSKTEPSQNNFNFSLGDNLVEFASRSSYGVIGHSLVQTSPSESALTLPTDLDCLIGSTQLQTKTS